MNLPMLDTSWKQKHIIGSLLAQLLSLSIILLRSLSIGTGISSTFFYGQRTFHRMDIPHFISLANMWVMLLRTVMGELWHRRMFSILLGIYTQEWNC